jgi:hypothetical protein
MEVQTVVKLDEKSKILKGQIFKLDRVGVANSDVKSNIINNAILVI